MPVSFCPSAGSGFNRGLGRAPFIGDAAVYLCPGVPLIEAVPLSDGQSHWWMLRSDPELNRVLRSCGQSAETVLQVRPQLVRIARALNSGQRDLARLLLAGTPLPWPVNPSLASWLEAEVISLTAPLHRPPSEEEDQLWLGIL